MATINSYRDLIAWQRAMELGLSVYRATGGFPSQERFGITNQVRRAAVSVPSNIAEGFGRGSADDYRRFIKVARGSLYEVDTQLQFAFNLGYLSESRHSELQQLIDECGRLITGLLRSIEGSNPSSH